MIHRYEIPEHPPSPPPRYETLPESLYGTLEEPDHFEVGTSHNVLSQFPDYINSDRRYFSHILSSETHLTPSSTRPFRYGMPDLAKTSSSPNVRSGVDPSATPGSTSIPFQADIFGSSYISPSTFQWQDPHTHNLGLVLVFPFMEVTLHM